MRKHRTKIVFAAVTVCLLAAAWMFGGNYANRGGGTESSVAPADTLSAAEAAAPAERAQAAPPASAGERSAEAAEAAAAPAPPPKDAGERAEDAADPSPADEAPPTEAPAHEDAPADETSAPPAPAMIIDPKTGKDKYLTDPVPEGKPLPVEPQDAEIGDDTLTATLAVRCDTILGNMALLDKEKHELVPADGVIFKTTAVTFYEGESVFNVLQREMKRAGIHMEFENTPIYNSAYIEGINNLYEFDVGELSGWMYKVNGWYPNYGCSRYRLEDGDVIEWHYTCDLGRDLGVEWLGGKMVQTEE
ncbi:MAG: DUF4430 domain-containing protein [Clostridiales Family XIII bacterium]|jgi:hypothetical protein|nr:DUF4430 domain-containing protein [Clostridiales Family XIII bacterium]